MPTELRLVFPDASHVQVGLRHEDGSDDTEPQAFAPPLDAKIGQELAWYLETYPAQYTTEVDDDRADSIAAHLPEWGSALFNAVFADRAARRLFDRFQDSEEQGRLLTIGSLDPAILAQPGELLRDPDGTFLFLETPPVSIRRRLFGNGRKPYRPKAKDALHLLFIVSRPADAGLIDPRADAMAVMDALDQEAPGRVSVEFLRPPTLRRLIERVNDNGLPPIDILHFDGHGAYDPDGRWTERARRAMAAGGAGELLKEAPAGAHRGYLLFEGEDGKSAPIPAASFGELLHRKQVGLVVLSACQSAMVGGEDALGSVAPRLIRAGIPSVLAMTQSVLVPTTKALSRYFYRNLAAGRTIGAALDAARAELYFHPTRGNRRRAADLIPLNLRDWFVPALYQADQDGALLKPARGKLAPPSAARDNLRLLQESGFHGRRRELLRIERWFVSGTRRIVITGFGGQGKTALAEEAGRWLLRTGLFDRVCFVTYAGFQGSDAVQVLLATLATVLAANLIDIDAAATALLAMPTLLILDNLESLEPAARSELLSAGVALTLRGGSRALLTSRPDDLADPAYPTEGSNLSRYLALDGLAPADALDWFRALLRLPPEPAVPVPKPEVVADLFGQVRCHPLSIGVLTPLLKQQRIADVAEALQARLRHDSDPLLASLTLSLARLDSDAQNMLPGFGVFADGALELVLTSVLELHDTEWIRVREELRDAGLVVTDKIPGFKQDFIRFHPTLASAMQESLADVDLARLRTRHRRAYYELVTFLYSIDSRQSTVARAIAYLELPNLLAAALGALAQGDSDAAGFADKVGRFLTAFGRIRDHTALQALASRDIGFPGSEPWFINRSNFGEELFRRGGFSEAASVFEDILHYLGEIRNYKRAVTLVQLARCYREQRKLDAAEASLREAGCIFPYLPPERNLRILESVVHTDLGRVLRLRGDLDNAETECETAQKISSEVQDERNVAIVKGQLGAIYLAKGDLPRAAQHYHEYIVTFERLREPLEVAGGYHQLGSIYMRVGDLSTAEAAYREAASIYESLGNPLHAARCWSNLAVLAEQQGRPLSDVEPWYRKALAVFDVEGDQYARAATLTNLANILLTAPDRLIDARNLSSQALTIQQTLDFSTTEIWETYKIIATIADRQGDPEAAALYRNEARRAYAAAPMARYVLRQYHAVIGDMLTALRQPAARAAIEETLAKAAEDRSNSFVAALRAILDGQRDEGALSVRLDHRGALIIHTILHCLDDPEAARAFLAPED
jgi:tetratricopeptide (TPR) repeat protein